MLQLDEAKTKIFYVSNVMTSHVTVLYALNVYNAVLAVTLILYCNGNL